MADAACGNGLSARRLVVVGASGLIGRRLVAAARTSGLACVATYASNPMPELVPFDMRTELLLNLVPDLGRRDTVILLGAYARQDWVFRHPEEARVLNVDATIRCAQEADSCGARVIFLSSEAVFPGDEDGGYDENAQVRPCSVYGRQKAEVEAGLVARIRRYTIVRTGWTVDPGEFERCPVRNTYEALLSGSARMARDSLFTLTSVHDVAAGLLALAASDYSGIVHLAANPPVSRSGLADLVIDLSAFGESMRYQEIRFRDLALEEPRPRSAWLDSTRSRAALNLCFRDARDVIVEKVAALDAQRAGASSRAESAGASLR